MKKIIVGILLISYMLNANMITISNENERWNVKGTIELETYRDNNFIVAKIKRGLLIGNKSKHVKKRYVKSMSLCVTEIDKKLNRWNSKICSDSYMINKMLYNGQIIQLEDHEFLIPVRSIRGKLSKKWFSISITCGGDRTSWCYMHKRKIKLNNIEYRDNH